jgi:hypothetical protein
MSLFEDRSIDVADEPEGEGAELLREVLAALQRFVVLPSEHAAIAVTLWIVATHAQDAWEHATRLVVKSPLKRCGKSRLLDMIEHLAHSALVAANLSAAALARSVTDSDPPTLVVDEQDAVFAKRHGERSESAETLRGLLNAGHQRGRPYVRWDVTTRALEKCPTFAMAAIAAIGDLPDTIEDRAAIVAMRRRAPGEQVTPFRRRRHAADLWDLRDRLHTWVTGHLKELKAAYPEMPVEDRAADTWEPLIAIADAAGGDWPRLAREACRALTAAASANDDGSLGERLLADLRDVFGQEEKLATETAIERLRKVNESPWADLYGSGLDARGLAKFLKPYGVKPKVVRLDDNKTARGYDRADLLDPWQRYLPPPKKDDDTEEEPVTPVTPPENMRNALTSDVTHVTDVTEGTRATGNGHLPGLDGYEHDDPRRFTQ